MDDTLAFLISFFGLLVGLAILTNKARAKIHYDKELHPNCLLTRWPLLFVTGQRSFFYFSNYWNIYPSYMAEHGYEVFHLHLPWSNPLLRRTRLLEFLKTQDEAKRRFHMIVDSPTLLEVDDVLRELRPDCVMSVTEIADSPLSNQTQSLKAPTVPQVTIEAIPSTKGSFFVSLSYSIHRVILFGRPLPSLSTLGALNSTQLQNARLILDRAQSLAEMDLRQD